MKTYVSDAALLFGILGDELMDLYATYVDDTIHVGNGKCAELYKNQKRNSSVRIYNRVTFNFSGLQIGGKNK